MMETTTNISLAKTQNCHHPRYRSAMSNTNSRERMLGRISLSVELQYLLSLKFFYNGRPRRFLSLNRMLKVCVDFFST